MSTSSNPYVIDITSVDGKQTIKVDIYCLLRAWKVTEPGAEQAIKKLLCAGKRGGGKTVTQDYAEAIIAIQSAIDFLKGSNCHTNAILDNLQLDANTRFMEQMGVDVKPIGDTPKDNPFKHSKSEDYVKRMVITEYGDGEIDIDNGHYGYVLKDCTVEVAINDPTVKDAPTMSFGKPNATNKTRGGKRTGIQDTRNKKGKTKKRK